jgi:hypothetical protein
MVAYLLAYMTESCVSVKWRSADEFRMSVPGARTFCLHWRGLQVHLGDTATDSPEPAAGHDA